MDYLHYWFGHYNGGGLNLSDINHLKRVELIENQIKSFNTRTAALSNSAGTDEFGQMIDFLTNQGNNSANKKAIFEGQDSSNVTIGGMNVASIASMGIGNIEKAITQNAEELSYALFEFQYSLTNAIEDAYSQLNSDVAFSEFQGRIVQEYAQNKRVSGSNIGKSILQDFLKVNGFKGLISSGSTSLESYLQRLALLAYAIPSYGGESYGYSTGTRSGIANNVPQFFKIIASKTSGLLSFVKRETGELAVMKAQDDLIKDFTKKIQDVNTSIRKMKPLSKGKEGWLSGSISVESDFDNLPSDKTKSNVRYSKGDVAVTVNSSNVSVTYGINVKDFKVNKGAKYQNINLSRSIPFLQAYANVFGGYSNSLDFLYQLAAGHGDGVEGYSDGVLNLYWNELVDTVVKGSFLDAIAGMPSDNVIYLTLNGKIFNIGDVAQRILNSEMGMSSGMSLSYSASGLDKSNTTDVINKWIGPNNRSAYHGRERSRVALPQVQSYLNRARINLDLKVLTALMIV